jgi:hypothetical protein
VIPEFDVMGQRVEIEPLHVDAGVMELAGQHPLVALCHELLRLAKGGQRLVGTDDGTGGCFNLSDCPILLDVSASPASVIKQGYPTPVVQLSIEACADGSPRFTLINLDKRPQALNHNHDPDFRTAESSTESAVTTSSSHCDRPLTAVGRMKASVQGPGDPAVPSARRAADAAAVVASTR